MLDTFNVNVVGTMRVTTTFADLLSHGDEPKLINITSQLGSLAKPLKGWGHYGYNSSKAAINMITRYLAIDLADASITSVCIHPGWVRTDMGGADADISPESSADGIWAVINQIGTGDNGKFLTYSGEAHPW